MPREFVFKVKGKERFKGEMQTHQCLGNTKRGQRCKRMVTIGYEYCTTHMKEYTKLEIKKSKISQAGKGLFAINTGNDNEVIFQTKQTIYPYHGEYIDDKELLRRYGEYTGPYAVKAKKNVNVDSALARGLASLANTRQRFERNNCIIGVNYKTTPPSVSIKARRPIRSGKEIYCSYGDDYNLNEKNVKFFDRPVSKRKNNNNTRSHALSTTSRRTRKQPSPLVLQEDNPVLEDNLVNTPDSQDALADKLVGEAFRRLSRQPPPLQKANPSPQKATRRRSHQSPLLQEANSSPQKATRGISPNPPPLQKANPSTQPLLELSKTPESPIPEEEIAILLSLAHAPVSKTQIPSQPFLEEEEGLFRSRQLVPQKIFASQHLLEEETQEKPKRKKKRPLNLLNNNNK